METKANFLLLGSVTVAGIACIMLFAAWLVGSEWRGGSNVYDIVFRGPIRGLSEGGEVRFNGIKVGEVRTLRIDEDNPSQVVARVRIAASTPVRTDSEAQLEAVGLTGVTLIQLSAGSAGARPLRPRLGAPPPRIVAKAGTIDELLTQENAERLTEVLANLRTITRELAQEDSVIFESAQAARRLAAAARSVDVAAQEMGPAFERAEAALDEAESAFAQLNDAAAVASTDTLPRVARAAEALEQASNASGRLVTHVDRSPATFLSGARRHTVQVAP